MNILHIVAVEIDRDGDQHGGRYARVVRVPLLVYEQLRQEMSEWRMERNQGPLGKDEPLLIRSLLVIDDAEMRVCRFER